MRWSSWSLRTRLLVEILALLAVVCVIMGVFTEFALRDYLYGQLDERVTLTSKRFTTPPPGTNGYDRPPLPLEEGGDPTTPSGGRPVPHDLRGAGNAVGTLSVLIIDGEPRKPQYLDGTSTPPVPREVPTETYATLLAVPVDPRPRTVRLGPLGDYRVVAAINVRGYPVVAGLPLADVEAILLRLRLIISGVTLGGLVLIGAAGALIVRHTLRPLQRVADAASHVAELPLDRGEVALSVRVPTADTDPRTEVGAVGNALNRMIGHVDAALAARQASETRVRQFVADASHELRTPLAAIRGYAELAQRGWLSGDADGVDELADVAYKLRRVESESARMATLVNDLLLLARLDVAASADSASSAGPRPLDSAPVDLPRLVVDAISDAHAAGPEHHWRLELPEDSAENAIVVTGDEARLHHVIGNLLTNARIHTPAGTTVAVRLFADDTHAVLTVTDDGPGIPPDQLPVVFDRFARGGTSRSRAAGSTGLGLAIVAAVVHAHDGTVNATSHPGRTTFTVHLPLK
jgi:two-component system OmpR family sensor kinase